MWRLGFEGLEFVAGEGEVRGDIARLDGPLALPCLEVVAVEAPWSHIVLSVGDVELSLLSIDSDAVGDLDILLRAVLDEVAVDDLLALGVDDGVADRVCPRDVAPFGALDEEGVTGERHVGAGDVKCLGDLLGLGVEDEDL